MKTTIRSALLWRLALFALLLAAPLEAAHAEEPAFGYTYTTDLLPKGHWEVEQQMTMRHKKAGGVFTLWEHASEIEYGVTDRLQLGVQANYFKTRASRNGVDGSTAPPESFAGVDIPASGHLNQSTYLGTSVEAIYRVFSPYIHPIGLAIVVEPTIGKGLRELESRLVFQKNFMEDRLVFASNITVTQEGRKLPADPEADPGDIASRSHWDHETDLNLGFAGSFRFVSNWSLGLEFQNEREFSSYRINSRFRTHSAYFLGPVIHYGGERFFVTATFTVQMPWGHDYANPHPGAIVGGRNFADDFEKYRLRIKAGISF
jgi:hypothetical protein